MLNAKNFALAGAIMWSLAWFLFVVFVLLTGVGLSFINTMMSSFIPDYTLNWLGAFLTLVFCFIDGFIFFYFMAVIYNALSKKTKKTENTESQNINQY